MGLETEGIVRPVVDGLDELQSTRASLSPLSGESTTVRLRAMVAQRWDQRDQRLLRKNTKSRLSLLYQIADCIYSVPHLSPHSHVVFYLFSLTVETAHEDSVRTQ